MRLSKQPFQDKYNVPKDFVNTPTYKLVERVGFVEFPMAGVPTFLPIGQRIMKNICDMIRQEAQREGFDEYYFPLLQSVEFLKKTGNYGPFIKEYIYVCSYEEREDSNVVLSATSEEPVLEMATRGLMSYRQLPIKCFQIADKFRYVKRARGIIRGRQFLSADFTTLDLDQEGLRESTESFERAAQNIFNRLGVKPRRIVKEDGSYVDFVVISPDGEQLTDDGLLASSIAMHHSFHINPNAQPIFDYKGVKRNVFIGTYGIGIQRCMHGVIEVYRDNKGINFPEEVRPFSHSVIIINAEDTTQIQLAERVYAKLSQKGYSPLLDDRIKCTLKEKADFSDFLGIPCKILIGKKEVEGGVLTVRDRSKNIRNISLEELIENGR